LSTNCELRSGEPTLLIPRSRKTCKKKKDKDEVYYDRLLPTWNALSRRPDETCYPDEQRHCRDDRRGFGGIGSATDQPDPQP
jgi:hypothetical protein